MGEVLDIAQELVHARIPGYDRQDGAQPWASHEVIKARAELGQIAQRVYQWAQAEPAGEQDSGTLDHEAQTVFGIGYDALVAAAQ